MSPTKHHAQRHSPDIPPIPSPLPVPPPDADLPGIVVLCTGSLGDYIPARRIGDALRQAGYPVLFLASERHRSIATAEGVPAIFYPESLSSDDTAVRGLPAWIARTQIFLNVLVRYRNRPVYYQKTAYLDRLLNSLRDAGWSYFLGCDWNPGFREFAERHPAAALHYVVTPAGVISSHGGCGIPRPQLPAFLRAPYGKVYWLFSNVLYYATCGSMRSRFRRQTGLPRRFRYRDCWGEVYGTTLGLFSSWYAPSQPDWPPIEYAGFLPVLDAPSNDAHRDGSVPAPPASLAPELAAFLRQAPTFLFTCGSHGTRVPDFFPVAIEFSRATRTQVLLLGGDRSLIPEKTLEESADLVRWFSFVPLGAALAECAALVHHGGIGTTIAAILQAKPQMVVPLILDHWAQAERVEELGVGVMLHPARWGLSAVRQRLTTLLDNPAFRERAAVFSRIEAGSRPLDAALEFIREQTGTRAMAASSAR